jgi:hypothetical protein
VNKGN